MEVLAECECNGHASSCSRRNDSYECDCTGFTEGRYCERCQSLYNQQPYSPGQPCQGQYTVMWMELSLPFVESKRFDTNALNFTHIYDLKHWSVVSM